VFDHSGFGEVKVPKGFPGHICLRRPASLPRDAGFASHVRDWRVRTVAFVRPGIYGYGVLFHGQRGRAWPAGQVHVMAGRITQLQPSIPTGYVDIELELIPNDVPAKLTYFPAYLHLGKPGARTTAAIAFLRDRKRDGIYTARQIRLPPGTWQLSVRLKGYEPLAREVTIGTDRATASVQLRRTR